MARMKFLVDAERCIECNGCVTACKNENEVPWGVNRRRVVTINDGIVGAEKSISVACMHCSDAPCMAVCPVDCFYKTEDGVVLHDKDLCIGCGYCFYACPFGAPQFPQAGAFGLRGKMDKCTFCAGGPEVDRSEGALNPHDALVVAYCGGPSCSAYKKAANAAKELGYTPEQIEWKESPSGQRETLIQQLLSWLTAHPGVDARHGQAADRGREPFAPEAVADEEGADPVLERQAVGQRNHGAVADGIDAVHGRDLRHVLGPRLFVELEPVDVEVDGL